MTSEMTLYTFDTKESINEWQVEDDTVMGGRSQGHLSYSEEGHAKFHGKVSLENNGGFSSIQTDFDKKDVSEFSHVKLRVKGDGKAYNFRVKESADQRHSYTQEFQTSGEWETIILNFEDFTPTYRGETPDLPNYSGNTMSHARFLIGNGKEQSFELLIDSISLE